MNSHTHWLVLILAAALAACGSSKTAQGARKGAASGAVAGAAGGLLSALVFGGDPVDRAARGAAWGAGAGAASGAMAGAQADQMEAQRKKAQAESELAKLRREIGEDSWKGLEALADGKHAVALANAEEAAKSDNKDYSLAGLWLEVLIYADKNHVHKARPLFPEIVARDPKIATEAEAEKEMREALEILRDTREEYGLPREFK